MTPFRAALLCCCLALAGCRAEVRTDGPVVHPVAVVAVGAVMVYELAVLAAPAFSYQGTKPRSNAARAQTATPVGRADTLVLMTLTRGPAEALSLPGQAAEITAELAKLGIILSPAQDAPADPDAFRFSKLEQRGLRQAVTVALDVVEKDDAGVEAVAELRLVDVATRERPAGQTLRRAVMPGETPARAHAALAGRVARAMAGLLTVKEAGPVQ